ncbi:glycosyltransferase [Sulfurimonas sp.]|uniref:glycosyltransferase n=1 Tax=Sulfurimonas sp. TaxID=2022749 RepID=UPI003D107C23
MELKIAATVILYNPEDDIVKNLQSYAKQVDKLIVVDNSTNKNDKLIEKIHSEIPHTIYIDNQDNLGIATALNIACDKALELNYDWILTMDQDSEFINFTDYLNCLQKFHAQDNIALLAPNTQWHARTYLPQNPTCTYEERFLVITSGNFLNLKLFNQIGRFEDKLFIDMVDHDYCMKANMQGLKIYFFNDILVEHSLGNLFQRKNPFTRKLRNKIEHSPQRAYYITRNFLYTWKQYSKQFPKEFHLLKTLNILFIHEITKILIYEDQKFKKIYAKFLGLFHFLIGKYGKYTL